MGHQVAGTGKALAALEQGAEEGVRADPPSLQLFHNPGALVEYFLASSAQSVAYLYSAAGERSLDGRDRGERRVGGNGRAAPRLAEVVCPSHD